jgi:SfnB family sulfur acquisition oxidoreductase
MSAEPVTAGTTSAGDRKSGEQPVHVIRSDDEALETVTKLAEEFRKTAMRRDRERILPFAEINALTEAGVFGITVPREYGGADVSAETISNVFRILAAADPNIGQIPQNHFCWLPVVTKATQEQAKFFFSRALAGERIGNAHSEDTRRKPGDYEHHLVKVDGGWRITGKKYYSTGAIFAQWIPFIAHLHDEGMPDGAYIFFANASEPGITIIDDWDGMGQRVTASGTTVFENVFVPDFNVFPLTPSPTDGRSFSLTANLIHGAIDLGIAEEALADAKTHIREHNRPWTGNPHDTHSKEPFIVRDYGRLGLMARTAAVSLRSAAQLIDEARKVSTAEAVLKARFAIADARILCSEAGTTIADGLFLLTGARATLGKYGYDRHWRNARTHSLHDPLRWKEYHLGNYYLNGELPPPGSYI